MWDFGIENGVVMTARAIYEANIYGSGGTIGAITTKRQPASTVIDAAGLVVLPGMIDAHVHSRDPGFPDKEDFFHSTRAAAAGGVTTILEMPNSVPAVMDAEALRKRRAYLADRAYVDYGLWGLALATTTSAEFQAMVEEGACGFKFFWGYALDPRTFELVYNPAPGADLLDPPSDGQVLEIFQRVAQTGRVLAVHAENQSVIGTLSRYADKLGYDALVQSRPELTEIMAIHAAIDLAEHTGARLHIVHLGAAEGARIVHAAAERGVQATCETCPQYLTLSDRDYARVGTPMKVYPPIRSEANRQGLVMALKEGLIRLIASDHAPHTAASKKGPLDQIPAGIAGVETLFRLILDMALRGDLELGQVVRYISEEPARLFGLYPQKGAILPGADADMVLVDLDGSWTVSADKLHSLNPLNPWEGQTLKGDIRATVLRGRVIFQDGSIVGSPGGCFVAPSNGQSNRALISSGSIKEQS